MHILLGLCLACGLLYFWLIGHWFARIVVFVPLAFVIFIALADHSKGDPGTILGACAAAALMWPLASIPTYYRRHEQRRIAQAMGQLTGYGQAPVTTAAHLALRQEHSRSRLLS